MKFLSSLLMVIGFCVGTLGAAGFQTPRLIDAAESTDGRVDSAESAPASERAPAVEESREAGGFETLAWPLFLSGIGAMLVGWILKFILATRTRDEVAHGAGDLTGTQAILLGILSLRDQVSGIASGTDPGDTQEQVGALLSGDFFDFTARHEEFATALGFTDYARIWDGVARSERILARSWSMLADGHEEEGLAELPLALASLEEAAREASDEA